MVASYEAINGALFRLPNKVLFTFFKVAFLKIQGAKIGKNFQVEKDVWINPARNIQVGNSVHFYEGCIITTKGGLVIGDNSILEAGVKIFTANHVIPNNRGRIFGSGHTAALVKIGANVVVERNCIILPGVALGDGVQVKMGSVVTKSVEAGKVVAGNPAKEIVL